MGLWFTQVSVWEPPEELGRKTMPHPPHAPAQHTQTHRGIHLRHQRQGWEKARISKNKSETR